jgi:hypothetical protein
MCTPTSCSSAPYSSHSRSVSVSPWTLRVWSKMFSAMRAFHLPNPRAVAVDVVEHQPLAQREVAERELVRAKAADDRVEKHGSGH